ncbi:MAG: putative toxin-antitoxin system toxin component, PIN family [Gammaproteobacteria bacterium]|nr:putative toxin-antitoxin system toxin component, PIN family [Gammaproteobacteria bacterium]
MRLVLDTNTVISGLLWSDGNPSKLIDAAEAGHIELFTSVPLLNELQRVIAREKFTKQLSKRQIAVRDLFDGYATLATIVTPEVIAPTIVRDPADDAVLACALDSCSEISIT